MSDKTPRQSKKFIAYLIASVGWKIAFFWIAPLGDRKFDHYSFTVAMALIVVEGFVQVGYILGQAALDKYAYLAEKGIDSSKGDPK